MQLSQCCFGGAVVLRQHVRHLLFLGLIFVFLFVVALVVSLGGPLGQSPFGAGPGSGMRTTHWKNIARKPSPEFWREGLGALPCYCRHWRFSFAGGGGCEAY